MESNEGKRVEGRRIESDCGAFALILVVSLIVATHMAIRWGKEKEAGTGESDDDIIGDLTEVVEEIGALAGDAVPIEEPK